MKRSYSIIIILFGLFTTFLIFPHITFAIPFSEKHAFCTDRMNINASNYVNQKVYNDCMENAEAYIKQSEELAKSFLKVFECNEECQKKKASEDAARKAKYEKERAEMKRKKEEENARQNSLFDAFN